MSISVYVALATSHRVREEYLKAVLRQDIGWFDSIGAGEVAVRITSDTLLIQDSIGEKLPIAAAQFATFVSGFVIAFYKSWQLTLVLLCVVPFVGVTGGIMNVIGGRFQTRIQAMYATSGNIAEEAIAASRTVTAFNAQKKVSSLYNVSLAGARAEGIKKFFITGVGLGCFTLFLYCSYSLSFWYGGKLLNDGVISTGTVVNVFFAVLIGAFSLAGIAPDLQAFAFGIGAGTKIYATIDRVPKIDPYSESGTTIPREAVKGRIELKDVEFTYPARPDVPILKKLSLTVEPGQTVALVGQSGSGKSTIVQLVERFYDPSAGEVTLDGISLKDVNVHSLRQIVGLVSQEPVLFEGTVAENIAQGLTGSAHENDPWEKKMELIQESCKQANAHEFVLKLPHGYDTQVGERGLLLSGGQKQRIAIARAIIKDPKILLLDEATSALDTTSERIVQAALDNVSKSRTTITIAHRLSTIKNADKIVVMVRGEIVEQGNHDFLLKNKGLYAKLVEAQEIAQKEEKMPVGAAADPDALPAVAVETKVGMSNSREDIHLEAAVEKAMPSREVLREIAKLSMPEIHYIVAGCIAAAGSGMIQPFFAIVFGTIISVFSKSGAALINDTQFWALIFLLLAALSFFFNFGQNAFFGFSSEYLTERLRMKTFQAILRQDVAFFDDEKHSTGGLTSNLSSDAQYVQGLAGLTMGSVINIATSLIAQVIIAFVYGPVLAAVAVCSLPLLLATGIMRIRILTYFSDKAKVSYERSAQVACESVAAIRTVQSLTRELNVYQKYVQMLDAPLQDGFKNAYLNTTFYAMTQSVGFLVNALIFWYGGRLIAYSGYDIQQFFTVFVSIVFGAQGAGRIFAYAPDLSKARFAGQNIISLLRRTPAIDSESTEGDVIENPQGLVQFEDVRFVYPHRPAVKVLKGLNIEVKPGQFAALVGPSGCGKSTTIGLIERFYDVTGGRVKLDGKDISTLNVAKYRNSIGLVSQEPNLFDMTIRENICFGCDFIPNQEEIEKAAKDANIHDFIMSLPEQYETRVGSKGSQMSGGQKQRVAIARALIRNPKVLLLDEATSALDAESEKVVQAALDKASKGRTTISIAHRLSTIQNADVIYVLENGVVKEKGTASELFKLKGLYYELAVQQNLSSN
ncbi:GTPase-activating protein [Kappamyces sp. JEL0680]|nr:GTPase-activating protein [Kappamyces sp. JEL0680]